MNKEKSNFILGLTVGAVAVLLISFVFASVIYKQKQGEVKKGEVEIGTLGKFDNNKVDKKYNNLIKVADSDHIRGNKNAPVTIVEFSDFQCPFCNKFSKTMEQAMINYPNDVRWVYKHFPIDSAHPYARKAAEASECADEQGKFWEYHDKLFSNQESINTDYLPVVAQELNLDMDRFNQCLLSEKYADKVSNDFAYGQELGVNAVPGNFINGQKMGGIVTDDQLKFMINGLLN